MIDHRRCSIIFRLLMCLALVVFAVTPSTAQELPHPTSFAASPAKSSGTTLQPTEKMKISPELLSALATDDIGFFERALSKGADPNIILPDSGKTLLMEAKSVPLVELLLKNGADPNIRDERGATALHDAVMRRDGALIIPMLIKKGADVNVEDGSERTPLIRAVVNDKPDLVELFLSLGADARFKTKDGKTALSWAEELGFVDIIELLEAAQADSR